MLEAFSRGEVEGGSASVPSLAVINDRVLGVVENQISLPPPSAWRLFWQPVQSDNEAKDNLRSLSRYRVGFRLRLEITWGALSVDDRADLIAKVNANVSQLIRCWPHEDTTSIFYDCLISEETDIDKYAVNAPIGYQGRLVLIGQRVYEDIPIELTMEPYDSESIKRGFCWSDATLPPGAYADTDAVCCFTDATIAANLYVGTDRVAYFNRGPRALGG